MRLISKFKNLNTYIYLLVLLVKFDMELSRNGFNNTFKRYAYKHLNIRDIKWDKESIEKTKSEIERIFHILDVVCVWYPRKADCIHKTLLGYKIIRKNFAIPVEMVIGIKKFPFEAHAWLQCNGDNFFDDQEETSRYNIILDSRELKKEDLK
ncbi:hypothetical protein COC60_14180 [Bacillus thuringiensis]|uniref:Lasso peptide biosynthesis B2 protein n=2 Tax=Bacillaceae TaxID=186817 RepID=A0A9W7Q5Q8_BACCE|nr:lasso peptide biosynthesis B2 protein [Bacillus sp. CR71]AXR21336.1 lasso peptide biosynthesis B2 protein [Bacillus sp. E25]KAA6467560.1 lasso peptide biosynthesis B2 protein [Bacillus cereus]MRC30039.1 lasso peptide biosynthesis B2 protein [Bacillus thuringiensis]KAB2419761.1 lasso peptide biosynthesis B2 protein [Bacillus cereus]